MEVTHSCVDGFTVKHITNDEDYAKLAKELLLGNYPDEKIKDMVEEVINDHLFQPLRDDIKAHIKRDIEFNLEHMKQVEKTIYDYQVDFVISATSFANTLRVVYREAPMCEFVQIECVISV